MIPVEQTMTKIGVGNCFQACLASILEVTIDDVPNCEQVGDAGGTDTDLRWLNERNLDVVVVDARVAKPRQRAAFSDYYIMGVRSPRFDGLHAVVGRSGEMVWDPHPLRSMGIGEVVAYIFLCAQAPSLPSYQSSICDCEQSAGGDDANFVCRQCGHYILTDDGDAFIESMQVAY